MKYDTRYYSISDYLKNYFGKKTVKLSIDGGFSCPNRDGTLSVGGCAFCSAGGSGELASSIDEQIAVLRSKWPDANYIAYFQSHTNTYGDVNELRRKYYAALDNPSICGIAISTRPDCIDDEVLKLLQEVNDKHFMWVELGLQSIHDKTQRAMNLCYNTAQYDETVEKLISSGIRVVTHLILGLPGESEQDIFESVEHVVSKDIFGLKLHLMNLVKGSQLATTMPEYSPFTDIEEYVDLVVRLLEVIPETITIHRLTGDVPRRLLIAPPWSYRKRTILNAIQRELNIRDTKQGAAIS